MNEREQKAWAIKNLVRDGAGGSLAVIDRALQNLLKFRVTTLYENLKETRWPECFGSSPYDVTFSIVYRITHNETGQFTVYDHEFKVEGNTLHVSDEISKDEVLRITFTR